MACTGSEQQMPLGRVLPHLKIVSDTKWQAAVGSLQSQTVQQRSTALDEAWSRAHPKGNVCVVGTAHGELVWRLERGSQICQAEDHLHGTSRLSWLTS